MALSLLQDAQTRGLAAALAGMKREEERGLTMSPPMTQTQNTSPIYSGLHSAAAASLGMLSPQLLAANRTAAALMAARLPMSTLASVSGLFPHHPALFGAWAQPHAMTSSLSGSGTSSSVHSPPTSPISPSVMAGKKHTHINNNSNTNNNNIVSTTTDVPVKKSRKISVKKDLLSPQYHTKPMEIPNNTHEHYNPGPISPPSSGSSPNSTQEASSIHGASKDPSRDKSFTCKICNRSFGYKHVLQNHERTHTGEKPFECPECHKRFTRDHHLKTHMRLHTGEKPYHCSHCDRQFVQVANLRRHLRVHTGERPYTCDVCDARFSDSNQLKSHILIHNGQKPFECERCHLKFRRRHHLMHHKCGLHSPPTPAISPAISTMSDHKSAISSTFGGSDESIDIGKTPSSSSLLMNPYELPLDLSEEGLIAAAAAAAAAAASTANGIGAANENEKRGRKSADVRRVIRMPKQIVHVPSGIPEQTEPEDLSMHSPRSPTHLLQSPLSSNHDDDLEDLDDAATLYLKQKNLLSNNISNKLLFSHPNSQHQQKRELVKDL